MLYKVHELDYLYEGFGNLYQSTVTETQVLDDLGDRADGSTIAVDQAPCPDCAEQISNSNVDRVIVPRDVDRPDRGIKTSATRASQGKAEIEPRVLKEDELKR